MIADHVKETASLYQQVTAWAEEEGWTVTPDILFDTRDYDREKAEKIALRIDTDNGAVHVEPRGRRWNKRYHAEIFAHPTYISVWLIKDPKNDTWQYTTDTGIPLYWEWRKDTFVRLVRDLQNQS